MSTGEGDPLPRIDASSEDDWRWRIGPHGARVTVYEGTSTGLLYVDFWDPEKENTTSRALGHRDRDRALEEAEELSRRIKAGKEAIRARDVTLDRLLRIYRKHRTPQKSEATQKADERRSDMWRRFLGPEKDPEQITRQEWEEFIRRRGEGSIGSRGREVPEKKQIEVGTATIEADLSFLKAVLNWGTEWQVDGEYLLDANPVRGFDIPSEKNPSRPIMSQDRYEALLAVADRVTMEVCWNGTRRERRSYLKELLVLANGTGRRISSILALRTDDLLSDVGPHGALRWRADADKMGQESVVPISEPVREALDAAIADRAHLETDLLFPASRDVTKPTRYERASEWLREAEDEAELEPMQDGVWHPLRRKWATERKEMSNVDVAAAGGWSSTRTLEMIYQQPDEDTMYEVVSGGGELREAS